MRESGLPQLHAQSPSPAHSDGNLLLGTYDALLAHCVPNSFLVSADGQLLHTFGDAGRFLKSESGRPVSFLAERILEDLRSAIAAGLRKVFRDQQPIQFASMEVKIDGQKEHVDLHFQPIEDKRTGILSCLIQIVEKEVRVQEVESIEMLPAEQVAALESELNIVKQSLQATIQELETSNEELQSTNEEMLSSNEELQSTNEELQSVNEELYTVNAEHQAKITELSELTRDMDNLLASTEVHTIFLDSELRIRKFTPRVADTFSLLPHDVGRQIEHFQHSIECQDLVKKLAAVVNTGEPHEEEVCDHRGNWYLMRLLPYQNMMPAQLT
ncbi:MAG: PAS domain-containing protein, partial [Planctomycetota bacterium]